MAPKEPLVYWIEPTIDLLRIYQEGESDEEDVEVAEQDPGGSGGLDGDTPPEPDEPEGESHRSEPPWAPLFEESALLRAFVGGGMWSPAGLKFCNYLEDAKCRDCPSRKWNSHHIWWGCLGAADARSAA
eukprot:9286720-Pyramimonas_sp.AAC.1